MEDQRENRREVHGPPAAGGAAGETPQGLTRPDKRKRPFLDLLNRGFTAPEPNVKWCGDITEIPTDKGELYLDTALDLFSRRLLGYATSAHPDAVLTGQAIKMAAATRGGNVAGVIFQTDRGSTCTADDLPACTRNLRLPSRWGGSGHVSTMPPRNHSSPRWNGRCCRVITSAPGMRPGKSSRDGCVTFTTKPGGTVPVA